MNLASLLRRFSSKRVRVYVDFIDPYSYIGFANLVRAASPDIVIEWRGFEFNPDTPMEGYLLLDLQNSDVRQAMWASVRGYAELSNLDLAEPQKAFNTKLAQTLIHSLPEGFERNAVALAIFRAYFEHGQDISQATVLGGMRSAVPSLAGSISRFLKRRPGGFALERYRAEAERARFAGLPGFVYQGRNYFGGLSQRAWDEIFNHPQSTIQKEIVCSTR